MRFGFVAAHRGTWPATLLCGALGVSCSGFYAWRTRAPSARARAAALGAAVRASFLASDRTYGARRVWHDVLEVGHAAGLAPNVLERAFTAVGPNQKWVADFTYVWTAEGWRYVAVVPDLYARRVVSWSMHSAMTTQLVTDALTMAVWRRGAGQAVLHHSDRGSQYTSAPFQRLLRTRRDLQHESVGPGLGQPRTT